MNGLPLTSYAEANWYGNIAYISQNPYLFAGTLADNIALGSDINESHLEEAVDAAGLRDVVSHLPSGLQTELGKGDMVCRCVNASVSPWHVRFINDRVSSYLTNRRPDLI